MYLQNKQIENLTIALEIFITVEGDSLVSKKVKIDWDLADQYVSLMDKVKGKYNLESSVTLQDMLPLESLFVTEEVPIVPTDLEALLMFLPPARTTRITSFL